MTRSDTFHLARNNLYVEHTPEQVAIMHMKRGIDGKEAGPSDIYDRLLEVFGKHAPGMPLTPVRQNAIRTVRRWVDDFEYEGLDVPYAPDEVDEEIRSYVQRLAIVKATMFKSEKLTVREANEAKRTLIEFQDPHGEKVDLIAQYAILWELVDRKTTGEESSDIEDLFAFAPWVSDEASQLYRLAVEEKLIKRFASLRLLAPLFTNRSRNTSIPELILGAHAQLNLPYKFSWIQEYPDKTRVFRVSSYVTEHNEITTDAGTLRSNCNWREFITQKLNDAPTETATIGTTREDQEQSND